MLEIQGHGSNVSLREILSAILDSGLQGVRMADPGEFTKLAFLNGKMDLSQAEAVIDIIKAKSDLSLGIAERQREGRLSAMHNRDQRCLFGYPLRRWLWISTILMRIRII